MQRNRISRDRYPDKHSSGFPVHFQIDPELPNLADAVFEVNYNIVSQNFSSVLLEEG